MGGLMRERAPGWEQRFEAAVRESLTRPFEMRRWNCACFAHHCAQAVRGAPLPFRWHQSLSGSVDAVLARVAPLEAHRGDVVMAAVPQDTLGVCVGDRGLFIAADGVVCRPLTACHTAWAV